MTIDKKVNCFYSATGGAWPLFGCYFWPWAIKVYILKWGFLHQGQPVLARWCLGEILASVFPNRSNCPRPNIATPNLVRSHNPFQLLKIRDPSQYLQEAVLAHGYLILALGLFFYFKF